MNRNVLSLATAIAAGSLAVAGPAFAQGTGVTFDPADTLDIVDSAVTFITTVGLAVLGLIMVAKGIKWVRKAG